jgi:general secretion pathway protein J
VNRSTKGRDQLGFTLLELTVALAIFAVLSTLAYGGLRQVLEARRETERVAERLAALQGALRQLELDLAQAAPRPIRDERGAPQGALVASVIGDLALELTSASWRNPAGLPRSTLRRVGYRVKNGVLFRYAWGVLDRSPDSEPVAEVLLSDVHQIALRFLDPQREWQREWPPLAEGTSGTQTLPVAVEVTLDLADWGVVQRLFRLPDARLPGSEASAGTSPSG